MTIKLNDTVRTSLGKVGEVIALYIREDSCADVQMARVQIIGDTEARDYRVEYLTKVDSQ